MSCNGDLLFYYTLSNENALSLCKSTSGHIANWALVCDSAAPSLLLFSPYAAEEGLHIVSSHEVSATQRHLTIYYILRGGAVSAGVV